MFTSVKEMCGQCQKVVYPTEKMVLEGNVIHKACFTCLHCKRKLTIGNFAAVNGQIYCKAHYLALFKEHGGRYDKAFGAFNSGRNLTGAQASGDDAKSEQPSELSVIKDEISTLSMNQSALLNQSVVSEAPSAVMTMNESVMTEASTASSVKARKEALERKSSTSSSQPPPQQPVKAAPAVVVDEGKAKALASKFERGQSASQLNASEDEPPQKKTPPSSLASSSSVRSLAGALDKSNIVSKLGQAYTAPKAPESAAVSSSSASAAGSEDKVVVPAGSGNLGQEEEESVPGQLDHYQMARPKISSTQRRKPTIEKGMFGTILVEESAPRSVEQSDSKTPEEEEEEEDLSQVDTSMAFLPASRSVELRQVLSSASGMFLELELKKRALMALVQQKKQLIVRMKEVQKTSVDATTMSAHHHNNPNEGAQEEEEEEETTTLIEDEDAFAAFGKEREGDLDGARACLLRALDRAMQQKPPFSEANARVIAAYASFAVRHDLDRLQEDDELAQRVSDAFDAVLDSPARDSVERERALFLHKVLGYSDEALDAFRRAYELYSDDAELVCNYASFLHRRVAKQMEVEEGDAKGAVEVRKTAADLFRRALELAPEEDVVRCNLAALLVQLSRSDANEEDALLQEAREVLSGADQTDAAVLYNTACVASLLNDMEQCKQVLGNAFQAKPSMREDAMEDPDLERARSCEWFATL